MAITVNANQLALSRKSSVGLVPLVVLETFSDRDARTVSKTFYWTRGHRLAYEWDGATVSAFEPLIAAISPVVRGFTHLPDQGEFSIREGMRLSIDATPRAGTYLWNDLLAERLLGARITIGSLLLDFTLADASTQWFDLTALGRIHIVRWRGEVTRIPTLDADSMTFELVADTEEMRIISTRTMSGVSTADPIDQGKPYPVPIGSQEVDALWFDVGFTGTVVVSDHNSGDTSQTYQVPVDRWKDWWYFTGTGAGDQTFAGRGRIGLLGEYFTWTNSSLDTATGIVSLTGVVNTFTSNHLIGETAYFTPTMMRFAISAAPVSGISKCVISSRWSDGAETEHPVDEHPVYSGYFVTPHKLTNMPNGDAGGHVAMITVADYAPSGRGFLTQLLADKENSYMTVTVDGTYTVGTTPTVIWDNSAAPNNDFQQRGEDTSVRTRQEQLYEAGPLTNAADDISMTNIGSEQYSLGWGFGASTYNARSNEIFKIFGSPLTPPFRVEMTLNFTANHLAVIREFYLFTNRGGEDGRTVATQDVFYYEQFMKYDVEKLVTGDNVILFDIVGDQAIDNLGFGIIQDNAYQNENVIIKGDWISYVITPTSPVGAHPIDIVELVVDDFLPTSGLAINATSFATAKTNTPDVQVSLDLAKWPTLGQFLAAIGFNSRINFVLSETYTGTELKAYAAETDYEFPAVSRALGSDYRGLTLTSRTLGEIANGFTAVYDQAPGTDGDRYASYRKSLQASALINPLSAKVPTATISTSVTEYGDRPAVETPFQMLRDETSVIDVLGYYAAESLRGEVPRYSCVIPFRLGYDLEAGDIVSIEIPWETSAVKARIVQTVFDFEANGIGINLEVVV